MADEKAAASAPADEKAAASTPADAKERFREALERKQGAARTAEGRRNTGAVHGPEVAGAPRRTFRRKTG